MKRIILALTIGLPSALAAFTIYALSVMDIERMILCASTQQQERGLFDNLCYVYLVNFRGSTKDIQTLTDGTGLEFILNGPDEDLKYTIAEHFIANGLDVNSVNHHGGHGYTPLHAAVLYNDLERTEFLLNHGASLTIRDQVGHLTPVEFARLLQQKTPDIDRSEIISLLDGHANGD